MTLKNNKNEAAEPMGPIEGTQHFLPLSDYQE
jgi:hypothetical protein